MSKAIVAFYGDYKGILYGESSMSIFDKDDKEVLHTWKRNPKLQTEEDLIEHLKKMDEFMDALNNIPDDVEDDNTENI